MDAVEFLLNEPEKRLQTPVINNESHSESMTPESATGLVDPEPSRVHKKAAFNRPKLTDPEDREIAMLKDKNAMMRKVANQCRNKLLLLQSSLTVMENVMKVLNGLVDAADEQVDESGSTSLESSKDTSVGSSSTKIQSKVAVKRVGSSTARPASISNQSSKLSGTRDTSASAVLQIIPKPAKGQSAPLNVKKKPFPISSFMDLNDYELGMRDEVVFERVKKFVVDRTHPYKKLPCVITAVLNTTITPDIQRHVKTLLNKGSGLKNFVRLLHAAVTKICPWPKIDEDGIRKFLTKPELQFGEEASSKTSENENLQQEGAVEWLQEDEDKEMEIEEHIFEEECDQSIADHEQVADRDVLSIDLKTEEE